MRSDPSDSSRPWPREHLHLPLSFSRWTGHVGIVAGPNVRPKQRRLWIRDATGDRIGFVLNEQYLFMQPGWEPLRSNVVSKLNSLRVPNESPSPEVIDQWDVRAGLSLWPYPYRDELHIYLDGPRGGHRRVGVFTPATRSLTRAPIGDRDELRDFLRRVGVLAPTEELAPTKHGASSRRSSLPRGKVPNHSPGAPAVGHQPRPAPSPASREIPPVLDTVIVDASDSRTHCRFIPVEVIVPSPLRSRVIERLRVSHQLSHEYKVDRQRINVTLTRVQTAGRLSSAFWTPRGRVDLEYYSGSHRGDPLPSPRWQGAMWPWPEDFEDWIDGLIRVYDGFFAAVAAYRAKHIHPLLWQTAARRAARASDGESTFDWSNLDEGRTAWTLASQIWWRTRSRRGWPSVSRKPCPICGEPFDPRESELRYVRRFRANRWCSGCLTAVLSANSRHSGASSMFPICDRESALPLLYESVRFLAAADGPVPRFGLPTVTAHEDKDDSAADLWFLARVAAPTVAELEMIAQRARWTTLLQQAGVLGESFRLSRGTVARSRDGHRCRSLFEVAIDDFLSENQIPHEIEPIYPYHAAYNPTGRRRADWRLPGGVLIEAAGMTGHAYESKLQEKIALARELGLTLIVIRPEDLSNLGHLLADALPIGWDK